jgi:cytochrome c oxidase subunit 4
MDAAHSAEFDKHVRGYIFVFVSLMVLTLMTVGVWRIHLPVRLAIAVALAIATVKGTLVACYFMHLISEKKLILSIMLLTIGLFIVLLLLPVWTVADRIGS